MFRTAMGPDEGMLFPYDQPRILSFWMRNTVLSLDIIFIGPDRRVINVAADAVPYSEQSLHSDAPAIAVLELNAGRRHGARHRRRQQGRLVDGHAAACPRGRDG